MQISAAGLGHTYAGKVSPTFANYYFAPAKDPIGTQLSDKNLDSKANDLKSVLDGVDLRHITSQQLADLGVKLYAAGEISDTSVGSFVVANTDLTDRNTQFDALSYFEAGFKRATDNPRELKGASSVYGDVLNTLYNLDTVIHAGSIIDTKA